MDNFLPATKMIVPAGFCPEAKTRGGTLGLPVCIHIPYLRVHNAHVFSAKKAPKIEMRILHRILCCRLVSLIGL